MVMISDLHPEVIKICRPLIIEDDILKMCSQLFAKNLGKGLSADEKEESPVKCSLTHVEDFPVGTEYGGAIGLGFCGKNFRIVHTWFKGNRDCVTASKLYEIPDQKIKEGNGPKMIEYLARCTANFIETTPRIRNEKIILGLAYGFPRKQESLQDSKIIQWSEDFNFDDILDKDFFVLFKLALKKYKATKNVYLISLVSDVTACLLSGLYRDQTTRVSITIGNGTNLCYVEKYKNMTAFSGDGLRSRTALDVDIKNFGDDGCLDFIKSEYDYAIDSHSVNPGRCIFEKLTSSLYLGELVRLCVLRLTDLGIILDGYSTVQLNTKGSLKAEDVAMMESDDEKSYKNCKKILQKLGYHKCKDFDLVQIRFVCRCFAKRSSNLTAACLAALLSRLQSRDVNIMADGFLVQRFPDYKNYLFKKIYLLKKPDVKFGLTIADREDVGIGAGLLATIYKDGVIRMEDKYRSLPFRSLKAKCEYEATGVPCRNCTGDSRDAFSSRLSVPGTPTNKIRPRSIGC